MENQLETLEHGRLAEQQRQKHNLQQRLAARKAKNARNKTAKAKIEEVKKQKEEEEAATRDELQDGVNDLFKRRGTIVLQDDDSELVRRLRAWRQAKKAHQEKVLLAEVATKQVDLDENEIKILVLKLMQVERMMREIRKKKKRQAQLAEANKIAKVGTFGSRAGGRNGSLKRVSEDGDRLSRVSSAKSGRRGFA